MEVNFLSDDNVDLSDDDLLEVLNLNGSNVLILTRLVQLDLYFWGC